MLHCQKLGHRQRQRTKLLRGDGAAGARKSRGLQSKTDVVEIQTEGNRCATQRGSGWLLLSGSAAGMTNTGCNSSPNVGDGQVGDQLAAICDHWRPCMWLQGHPANVGARCGGTRERSGGLWLCRRKLCFTNRTAPTPAACIVHRSLASLLSCTVSKCALKQPRAPRT